MFNRSMLVGIAGLGIVCGTAFCRAGTVISPQRPAIRSLDEEKDNDKDSEKDEKNVAVDQLPQAVVDTVKKTVPDGTITEAEQGQEDGKSVYELEVKSSNTAYEIKTDLNGTLISKEVDDEAGDKK